MLRRHWQRDLDDIVGRVSRGREKSCSLACLVGRAEVDIRSLVDVLRPAGQEVKKRKRRKELPWRCFSDHSVLSVPRCSLEVQTKDIRTVSRRLGMVSLGLEGVILTRS